MQKERNWPGAGGDKTKPGKGARIGAGSNRMRQSDKDSGEMLRFEQMNPADGGTEQQEGREKGLAL